MGPLRLKRRGRARAVEKSLRGHRRAFHVSADAVYVTVCRVKKAWARRGREYFRAA